MRDAYFSVFHPIKKILNASHLRVHNFFLVNACSCAFQILKGLMCKVTCDTKIFEKKQFLFFDETPFFWVKFVRNIQIVRTSNCWWWYEYGNISATFDLGDSIHEIQLNERITRRGNINLCSLHALLHHLILTVKWGNFDWFWRFFESFENMQHHTSPSYWM